MSRRKTLPFFAAVLMVFALVGDAVSQDNNMIKEPNVAGQFYDADPQRLQKQIKNFLYKAGPMSVTTDIGVMIVPHAGYVYSGGVAAHAFKAASQQSFQTIILLGPTHYHRFKGIAAWPQGGFATPLGVVDVDDEFLSALMRRLPLIQNLPQIFEQDHVLEVELPFLQVVFGEAKIVPLIMNRDAPRALIEQLAKALADTAGERGDVLLIVSSDMSHFHEDAEARMIDQRGMEAVRQMDIERLWKDHADGLMEIDGFKEVITALEYAKIRGLSNSQVLKYANSGDINGDKGRVVGYMSVIISR